MKMSQVMSRLLIKMGINLGIGVSPSASFGDIKTLNGIDELDFDTSFISRFSVQDIMMDRIELLHNCESINWKTTWYFKNESALWNYNLHYFEYLFSLVDAWKRTGESKYIVKTFEIISGWIYVNKKGTSPAWDSYTTALRLTAWISYYSYANEAMPDDFRNAFLSSLHEQYVHLSKHLEKDILGNHYFEDLKSLVLASAFFNDEKVLNKALNKFKAECKEEILADGMHFELSPMYHKVILEGVIRIAAALRDIGRQDAQIESYVQSMLDIAYSFENGLDRIPLFNDCGNNVSKSLTALVETVSNRLGMRPNTVSRLETAGFYIFNKTINDKNFRLIVDAGQPGPKYIPGHAHCDAMSFELFCDGKPVVVNCGTYGYQCLERGFFRSTAAHNTVMVDGIEQSQCWGAFRLSKRSYTKVLSVTDDSISMELRDQNGNVIQRKINFEENITVTDKSDGNDILSYLHCLNGFKPQISDVSVHSYQDPYAEEYGRKQNVKAYEMRAENIIKYTIVNDSVELSDSVEEGNISSIRFKPMASVKDRLYFYRSGNLWTYRNGKMRFVVHVFNTSWKERLRLLNRLYRLEPKYAVPVDDHRLIVVGFKKLVLVDIDNKDVRVIAESRNGFSDPLNLCQADNKWLMLWGEYGSNSEHDSVSIFGLCDDLNVEQIHVFDKGQIRHVHNIIKKTDCGYYIFTGDQEDNSGIYSADCDFNSISPVLTGKQQYRAVIGFDTPQGLLYATDAVNEQNYVYLMKDNEVKPLCTLNGSCIYGTEHKGRYYFATTVEPDENNRGFFSWFSRKRGKGILSNEVTLVEIDPTMNANVIKKFKKDSWPMKLLQYGSIQFPHGNYSQLWIYPVAVKKFDGVAMRLETDHEE